MMARAWSRTWRWKLSIRSSSGGHEHMPCGSQRCFQRLCSSRFGLGRNSQDRQLNAWPGNLLTIGPVPQRGTSARPSPIRKAGSPSSETWGYSRAAAAIANAKSSPAVCCPATTSEYKSGVSRRSISDRLRTYRK